MKKPRRRAYAIYDERVWFTPQEAMLLEFVGVRHRPPKESELLRTGWGHAGVLCIERRDKEPLPLRSCGKEDTKHVDPGGTD